MKRKTKRQENMINTRERVTESYDSSTIVIAIVLLMSLPRENKTTRDARLVNLEMSMLNK